MILGIGIDIVDNDRMALAIERHPKIVDKILTSSEISELGIQSKTPLSKSDINSISARFAAKEALSKSLGVIPFKIGLQNIMVSKSENGAPQITVNSQKYQHVSFLCSITHSDLSSAAVVIAQENIE